MNAVLAQSTRDDLVVGQRDALLVHLGEAALVDEGLVDLQEDAIVQLTEPKELENLPRFRAELVDSGNSDNKKELRLGLHEEVSRRLRLPAGSDQRALGVHVLLVEFERAGQ